ncbi:MAG: hypothetical protein AAGA29_06870 [Planctomycetota bacterium]
MKLTLPDMKTVLLARPKGDPARLSIHPLGSPVTNEPDCARPLTIPVRADTEITAVALTPHGIVLADGTARIRCWPCDLSALGFESASVTGAPAGSGGLGPPTSVWIGAPVDVLVWMHPGYIICGDRAGRLMRLDLERDDQPLDIITTASAPWIASAPYGERDAVAVAGDGHWTLFNHEGRIDQTGRLPVVDGRVVRVQACREAELLLYQVSAAGFDNPNTPPLPGDEWRAWHIPSRQPLPVPDPLRYAQVLIAAGRGVVAANAQGHACRWSPGTEPADASEPHPLTGWPAGPVNEIGLLDESPVLFRLDTAGRAEVLHLHGDSWHRCNDLLPATHYSQLWAAEPGVIDRAIRSQLQHNKLQLTDRILAAHQEERLGERDRLLDQLPADSTRRRTLLASFAADDGDLLAALGHLRHVVTTEGNTPEPNLLRYYGRLLWRSGAICELLEYDAARWPDLYTELLPKIDGEWFHAQGDYLVDAFSPDAPDDCPWRELAWSCVTAHGTRSSYWLGGEQLAPFSLLPSDIELLGVALEACGASPASFSVLSPSGQVEAVAGWVFSDKVLDTPLQRQLVAWLQGADAPTLNLRWAVKAEGPAFPDAWTAGWTSLHDPVWRNVHERHIEIVRQAIACGVPPEPAVAVSPSTPGSR